MILYALALNHWANALDKNIPIVYIVYMVCDLSYSSENSSVLTSVFRTLGTVFAYPPSLQPPAAFSATPQFGGITALSNRCQVRHRRT
jgi:hypothetical protein